MRLAGANDAARIAARLLGPVVALCVLVGCGRTDAPAAAPAPSPRAAPANVNVVRIPADSPQLRQIRVEPVQSAQVPEDELVAPGRITMNPNRISRVVPPVSGRVVKVMVRLGDHVEQGQPLIGIDSPDADTAISAFLQAEATERQAKATQLKTERDVKRAKDLYEHQAVAEKDVLQAENDAATAKSAYEIAVATRHQTSRKLQLLELKPSELHQIVQVRAPFSGQVLEVNVAPGEYRAAISFHTDTTAPLVSIADLSTVWFSSDVPEPFVRLIHLGEPVAISLVAFPDEVFTGRIARVGDVLDSQSRTLKVHVELPNPQGRFRPEMFGSVRHSGPARPALVVPTAAVVQEYGRAVVFVERGPGEFERRQVTTGVRLGNRVAIVNGLTPDDRVIVDGAMLLKGQ